ncbi:winged helix-turn-helix transcriptional regulator [Micromonospora sp. URMC 106]|uniref:winged helix-turn-helix transcriptional regulator n=1 Tax=Micromonospora sp. URMC 106 TaxID=3423408 RepID=UPI003F1D8B2D
MTSQSAGPELASTHWTDPECPVARAVDLVGDRWSLLIVRDAMDGVRAFTDFQRSLGVARNILSDRLRRLVAHGILAREIAPSGKRQEYVLTEVGHDLFTAVLALRQWGERHAFAPGEAHSVLLDDTAAVVPELRPTGHGGQDLSDHNTRVRKVERRHRSAG